MAESISQIGYDESTERGQEFLWDNGYPGRWLAIGRGEGVHEGELFLAYSFGGRSDGSKNRTAIAEADTTRLIAPGMDQEQMAKVPDAALIYYHAIDTDDEVFAISNGAQTRHVLDAVAGGETFEYAVTNAPKVPGVVNGKKVDIDLSSFEPDDPIMTPRITGVVDLRPDANTPIGLAIARRDPGTGHTVRSFYTGRLEDIEPGQGWAIQTYGVNDPADRETPPPSFDQEPYAFPMNGNTTEIAARVADAIGETTFAAAVVRSIDTNTRQFKGCTIINTRG